MDPVFGYEDLVSAYFGIPRAYRPDSAQIWCVECARTLEEHAWLSPDELRGCGLLRYLEHLMG